MKSVRTIAVLWVAFGGAVIGGASFSGAQSPAVAQPMAAVQPPALEFRLAEPEPGDGLTAAKVHDTGDNVYLHDDAVVTIDDIQAMTVHDEKPPTLALRFNSSGEARMRSATSHNIGKQLAVVADGEVLMTPTIKSTIGRDVTISGGELTIESLQQLAERIASARPGIVFETASTTDYRARIMIVAMMVAIVVGLLAVLPVLLFSKRSQKPA